MTSESLKMEPEVTERKIPRSCAIKILSAWSWELATHGTAKHNIVAVVLKKLETVPKINQATVSLPASLQR